VETTKYMSDEIATEIAESVSENTAETNNITAGDFVASRLANLKEQAEAPPEQLGSEEAQPEEEPVVETESEESETEAEAIAPEAEVKEESENVLSQLDLDDMSEDDLRELSEKLGSRAVARFGELTAKRKAAEERATMLEAKLQETPKTLTAPETVANNPFASLDTVEALQEKASEVNSVIEWAEDTLFNADGYGPEDVVVTVNNQELTKADVRKTLLNSRKSRDKFLPAQLNTIQAKEQGNQLKESYVSKAVEELSWLSGDDNDTRHQYNAIMQDKRVEDMLKSLPPDVSAQMPYLMAHAANSLYGRKPVPADKPKASATLNPPKSVDSGATKSEKTVDPSNKAVKKLVDQFKTSGHQADFVKFRTQQLTNR